MNYKIEYDIDYSALKDIVDYIKNKMGETPHLIEAVEAGGDFIVQSWIDTAGQKLSHSMGGYAQGIVSGVKYPFREDPLRYLAENIKPYARMLEDGYPSFDQKKALLTSDKVRISKDGNRYLIIPFRHGIPGTKSFQAMPKDIYAGAKDLKQSAVLRTFKEGSIKGAKTQADADLLRHSNPNKVTRRGYEWGDKLKTVNGQPLEKTSTYYGMVRFQNTVNKNRESFNMGKFGGGKNTTDNFRDSSSYMTFRIMSEKSSGWIHPGIKAMNILKETIERTRQPVLMMLSEAAKQDLQRIGNFQ